jgi:hypothetical protein
VISARNASLLSAIVAAGVLETVAIVALVINEPLADVGIGAAVVRLLGIGLVTFGVVAGSVRLGLRMSLSKETRVWVAIVVPLISMVLLWFTPAIPLERLGGAFAMSHPTALAGAILFFAMLVEVACVLIAVTFAFGYLSRRWPVPPDASLERIREE